MKNDRLRIDLRKIIDLKKMKRNKSKKLLMLLKLT